MHSGNSIASKLHPPTTPRLSSLNGNSDSRHVTTTTSNNNNNSNATVSRGTIRHNNPNTKSDKQQNSQQERFVSHGHFEGTNNRRRIDSHNNNGSLSPPFAHHFQTDHDVRYSSSPPSESTIDTYSTGHSFTKELDSFLDLYEEKHGLEPLEKTQVQGLPNVLSMSSLLLLSPLITVSSQDQEIYQKTAQILRKDSRKVEIASTFSSLDLSRLPAASLSQDDIQDRSLSNNNNGREILNIRQRKQPLSPIKEESEDLVKSNASNNVTKSNHDDQTIQNKMRNSTKPVKNTEVDKTESFTISVKKTSGTTRTVTSPPPQQPQHIDNLKTAIEKPKGKNATITKKAISAVAPDVSTAGIAGPEYSVLRNTVGTTSLASSSSSKIPVPLPKTRQNHKPPSPIVCNIKSNKKEMPSKQAQSPAVAEKAEMKQVKNTKTGGNHNIFPLKKQLLPHSNIPTAGSTPLQEKSYAKGSINPRNIGQGDEIVECLNLIGYFP